MAENNPRPTNPPLLQAASLQVAAGDKILIDQISLTLERGSSLSVMGPSGSGKTTLLKALSGCLRLSSGSIHSAGRDITSLPPGARQMGFVFQQPSLFPNLRVLDNVAFGLECRGIEKKQRRARADELLEWAGLQALAQRFPQSLSGGEAQRIAILRSLAYEPDILLLDEPLASVDQAARGPIVELLRSIPAQRNLGLIFVSHDIQEAFAIGGRIMLMSNGRVHAQDDRDRLYANPPGLLAARLLGFDNFLELGDGDGKGRTGCVFSSRVPKLSHGDQETRKESEAKAIPRMPVSGSNLDFAARVVSWAPGLGGADVTLEAGDQRFRVCPAGVDYLAPGQWMRVFLDWRDLRFPQAGEKK